MSTSSESYQAMLSTGAQETVAERILGTIAVYPGLSRSDIAELDDIRIQTVCGAVNKLIKDRKVRVSGSYTDPNTNRRVEKLEAIPQYLEEA